jgi:hypothetical protein
MVPRQPRCLPHGAGALHRAGGRTAHPPRAPAAGGGARAACHTSSPKN